MLRTSNTATIPKYVGIPPRKSAKSNCPVKITAHRATKATRANALWKPLDQGTEITNITAPTPRKSSVPKEPGANVCQTYPARKATPNTGRNLSKRDLKLHASVAYRCSLSPLARSPVAKIQPSPTILEHGRDGSRGVAVAPGPVPREGIEHLLSG